MLHLLMSLLRSSKQGRSRKLRKTKRQVAFEAMEPRHVLASTVFLDFGLGLPAAGLTTTVADTDPAKTNIRDFHAAGAGPDLTSGTIALPAATDLTLKPLSYDFDKDGTPESSDIAALQSEILAIVERALQPFDIQVKVARASSLADISRTLNANKGDAKGEFDAYVLINTVTSASAGGGSVALGTGLLGEAAGLDLGTAGNTHDEIVIVYADEILDSVTDAHGTPAANEALAFRIAYTAAHEAAHTLALSHTFGANANEQLLSQGDQIRFQTSTRETHNVFTRFDLRENGSPTVVNNFEKLRDDADLGLVDANRNNVPDFAYVTGTGAHDRIRLTPQPNDASGRARILVQVEAFSDAARTSRISIESYTITVFTGAEATFQKDGTEGPIRIDAGVGNDLVEVMPPPNSQISPITNQLIIFGGEGDDTLRGGAGTDRIFGEDGNDTINGGDGDDMLDAGDGNDTVQGGAGNDVLIGGKGNDVLQGDAGNDVILGRQGDDQLTGGDGDDALFGNSGKDTLRGDAGSDTLYGGADADTLDGGADQDQLFGGGGIDNLNGGAGADTIHNPDGNDVVASDASDTVIGPAAPAAAPNGAAAGPQATGTLSSAAIQAIRAGLGQLVATTESAGGTLPVGNQQVGNILGDIVGRGLVQPVVKFLDASGAAATVEGLVNVLSSLSDGGGDLTVSTEDARAVDASGPRFDLRFTASRNDRTTLRNLAAGTDHVPAGGQETEVPIVATANFELSFGVANGEFYVLLPSGGIDVATQIDASGLSLPVNVGLLGGQTEDAAIRLNAVTNIRLADANADGRLSIGEIAASGATANTRGTFLAELPFQAQLGTFQDAGAITVVDNDLSDGNAATVQLAGSEDVQQFAAVNRFAIGQWLSELGDWLDIVADNPLLRANLPFTENLQLSEAADFAAAMKTHVFDVLIAEDGTPKFETAQDLVARLSTALGVGPKVLSASYDPSTDKLTFHVDFTHTIERDVPLALDLDFGPLADVQIGSETAPNPQLQLAATIGAGLVFGVNLAPTPAEQLTAATPLSVLNGGNGISINTAETDLVVTLTDGTSFTVDLTNEQTVGQVIQKIEAASGGKVDVAVDSQNNGLRLVQDASLTTGANALAVAPINGSLAAAGLGLLAPSQNAEIKGAAIFGSSTLDRFFLSKASFEANVSASIDDLDASARLGIFDLALVDGLGSVNIDVAVDVSNIEGGLADAVVDPHVSGSANINVPVRLAAEVGGVSLPVNTGLAIDWSDITNTDALSVRVSPEADFGALADQLESIAIGQIVEGLKQLVDFVRNATSSGVFAQDIPIAGRSLADLLDVAEKLEALRGHLDTNPPSTINEAVAQINELLDSSATAVRFNGGSLELDLSYDLEKTEQLDLSFNLGEQVDLGVVEQFVDVNASVPVTLSLGGNASLGLVIDVSDPSSPEFFVKDSSGITVEALINAADIDLEAAIGPLGVFVRDGFLRLDNGAVGDPAAWTVSLANGAGGRQSLSSLISSPGSSVSSNVVGRVEANLPIALPTPDEVQGSIHVTVGSLSDVAGTFDLDESSLPDLDALIDNLDLSDLIDLVIDGLDRVLGLVEDRFGGVDVPLIGGNVDKATEFLTDIRERVISRLEELDGLTGDVVTQKIFEALGPKASGGLGFLADRTGDGVIDASDVDVTISTSEKRADVAFKLAGQYDLNESIDVELGLDGLGLDIDADLKLAVDFAFDVGFGVSGAEGFYLHAGQAGDDPELRVNLDATISEPGDLASATAHLAFLRLTATDKLTTRPDGTQSGSYFVGAFTVDLQEPSGDGRLTLAELQSASKLDDVLAARLAADANVQLALEAGIGESSALPRVAADFELRWQFDTSDTSLDGTIEALGFRNVRLHIGDLVSQTIGPALDTINDVLAPIRPIADALTTRLPVISDLSGEDVTLLSLAETVGQIGGGTAQFLNTVAEFANFTASVQDVLGALPNPGSGGFLPFGDLLLDAEAARDAGNMGKLQPTSQAAGLDGNDRQSLQDLQNQSGFSVPVLNDPGQLFGLFLGQDALLVSYDLPRLELNFAYDQFFPVIGPLGVTLRGEVGAAADFKFGFDTRGLRQFADGGYEDPELILNGLFVSDTANADGSGPDVPELEIFGGIQAFATVNVGFLEFGGGGGIKAKVQVDLNDPDHDGRMYYQEIVGAFQHSDALARLINIRGELSAELEVYAEALFTRHEKEIAKATLFDFSLLDSSSAEPDPVLGIVDAATGELRLNSGPRAGERLFQGETLDGNEEFLITAGSQPDEIVVTLNGENGVHTQTFTGVTRLMVDGGEGDDTITVDENVTIPVELSGGAGDDVLTSGGGPAILFGGAGNDELNAGSAAATLEGGAGDDVLRGGDANDTLRGGDGNDTLEGGAGDDTLEGQAGNDELRGEAGADVLVGGEGNDALFGGDGNDNLSGGLGNDLLHGEAGADTLLGGDGDDTLLGGDGADLLGGEAGDDEIRGGDGDDRIDGGRGNDRLFGDAGRDVVFGDLGADLLDGGEGNDVLHGGVGADVIHGGAGDDMLFGDLGVDTLFGELGNDTLRGGSGNDLLFGGDGADALEGELGSDVIDGQSGEDRIQFAVTLVDPNNQDTLRGGPHRDVIEILGTEEADELTATQLDATTFQVERRDIGGSEVTATFQFTLPADPRDRDIELLRVSGLGGDDVIRANGTFNVNQFQINGGDGDDLLEGSAGDDLIFGGAGNDTLLGHDGRDELHGGDGADTLRGGDGSDALYGEAGDDTLLGEADSDVLYGGAGDDRLEAGEGILGDILFGDDDGATVGGNDILIGGDGVDVLYGGPGDDRLEGGALSDILNGDAGNDTLIGGTGRDFLSGGEGDDHLVAMFDDDSEEPATPDVNWAEIDKELDEREDPLRDQIEDSINVELKEIGARLFDLTGTNPVSGVNAVVNQSQLTILKNSGDPVVRQLAIDASELDARRRDLANTLNVILETRQDINPYQTVTVDILVGGTGNDTLRGSVNADRLIGDSGNDIFVHSTGADLVFGGSDPLPTGQETTDGAGERDEYRVFGTENDDVIFVRLVPAIGNTAPQVFVEVNGTPTQASHLGIEVAGVKALAGDDHVTVDFGQNAAMKVAIDGGDGNDLLDASTFQDDATLIGGSGNDTLIGGLGDDVLDGGEGDDLLTGGAGHDAIDGGAGSDRLIEAVEGTVQLDDAKLSVQPDGPATPTVDTLSGLEEAELKGGDTDDTIDASRFTKIVTLVGNGGNDTLMGGSGNDVIDGGDGDDVISGGDGNDTLIGGEGTDRLKEQVDGHVTLSAERLVVGNVIVRPDVVVPNLEILQVATPSVFGGTTNFTNPFGSQTSLFGSTLPFVLNTTFDRPQVLAPPSTESSPVAPQVSVRFTDSLDGFEAAELDGGSGDDVLDARQFNAAATLRGGAGDDTLHGTPFGDTLEGGDGSDTIHGMDGNDALLGQSGNDTIFGENGDDVIDGGAGNDQLQGGDGNDTLRGDEGNDTLRGDAGNDILRGGNGNDSLIGGTGDDELHGESGDDSLSGEQDADRLFGGSGNDSLSGGSDNDMLEGQLGDDTLHGDDGNDTLNGGDGRDTLFGDSGNDTLRGGNGNDTLRGGSGNDSLFGNAGTDQLFGDSGGDFLDGGQDGRQDVLTGGQGADTFKQYFRSVRVKNQLELRFQESVADFRSFEGDQMQSVNESSSTGSPFTQVQFVGSFFSLS